MASTGGYLYAMQAVGTPYIKIGCTRSTPAKRLKILQTGQPFPLSVLASVQVDTHLHVIEKAIHAFLVEHKKHGEWFDIALDTPALEALVLRAIQFLTEEGAVELPGTYDGRLLVDMARLGQRLLLMRRRAGMSQHELARQAEVDVMTISRLERGGKKRLEVEQLARLAKALHVTTDHFLGLTGEEGSSHE